MYFLILIIIYYFRNGLGFILKYFGKSSIDSESRNNSFICSIYLKYDVEAALL